MSPQTTGILLGGVLAAVAFGICGIFVKASLQAGIGVGPYLIAAGLGIVLTGIALLIFVRDSRISPLSGFHAVLVGVTWAIGAGLVTLGIAKYGVPLAKITPLYNTNTLITVLLALWIFAEWKELHLPRLLLGASLIVLGGILVAKA